MATHGNTRRSYRSFMLRAATPLSFLLLSACATGTVDEGTVFYPPLPELPRLQFLTTINTEKDIGGAGGGISLFGAKKRSRGFARPFDVAHEKGKIYVADPDMASIVTVDLAGKKFTLIHETEGGPFRSPMSVFVAENGHKYIADSGRGQVLVLDETNMFLRAYGKKGQFRPLAAVADGDRVYVCDVQENEIEILNRESGELIGKIGGPGPDDAQFHWPTRLALDSEGSLYVTDFLNFRVQKFDRDGRFVRSIGELGNFPGATPRPKGIAADRDGHLYVLDGAFEIAQIFDSRTAENLLGFGKRPKPGGNWLPAGIDIDYDNLEYFSQYVDKNFRAKYLVYIVNQAGPRMLNVYAFGDWIGPMPKGAQPPAADATQPPAESGT